MRLPDKDLYPNWRARIIRERFCWHNVEAFLLDCFEWLGCLAIVLSLLALVLWADDAKSAEWNDWVEENTGARAYFDVGVGYQIDSMSDWYVQTDRDWQCSQNWEAHFGFGLDWGRASLGYQHQSWWVCGGPYWNDRPELYSDRILFNYRFGGK